MVLQKRRRARRHSTSPLPPSPIPTRLSCPIRPSPFSCFLLLFSAIFPLTTSFTLHLPSSSSPIHLFLFLLCSRTGSTLSVSLAWKCLRSVLWEHSREHLSIHSHPCIPDHAVQLNRTANCITNCHCHHRATALYSLAIVLILDSNYLR